MSSAVFKASVKAVQRIERKVIKRALKTIEQGALNATKVDDDGTGVDDEGNPVELSVREKRVAMDMRKSKRNAPVYIDVLTRRLESAEKADAMSNQGERAQLNIGTVNIVQAAPQYEVINVDAKEKP